MDSLAVKTTFIYALCEPGTRTVRYIGKADSPEKRYKKHLQVSAKKHTPLGKWLRSLPERPVLVVLHEVSEKEFWPEEERRYISCARAIGMDLVNATVGGQGCSGPHSLEHCAAIRASLKGKPTGPCSPERRAAISASKMGVPLSPACRAAISASKTGVPRSLKSRAAQSTSTKGVPKGPHSSERREKLSRSVAAFWSRNNISTDNW